MKRITYLVFALWVIQFSALAIKYDDVPQNLLELRMIDRANFRQLPLTAALEFAQEKCNEQGGDLNGEKIVFELRFSAAAAARTVTFDMRDVSLGKLLHRICDSNGVAFKERDGKLVFFDVKKK